MLILILILLKTHIVGIIEVVLTNTSNHVLIKFRPSLYIVKYGWQAYALG